MAWISNHRRIGPVGSPFVPNPGTNVDALEQDGFIVWVPDGKDTAPPTAERKVTPRKRKD